MASRTAADICSPCCKAGTFILLSALVLSVVAVQKVAALHVGKAVTSTSYYSLFHIFSPFFLPFKNKFKHQIHEL